MRLAIQAALGASDAPASKAVMHWRQIECGCTGIVRCIRCHGKSDSFGIG